MYVIPPSHLIQVFESKSMISTTEININSSEKLGITFFLRNMIIHIEPEVNKELEVGDIILKLNGSSVTNPWKHDLLKKKIYLWFRI